ncbi:DMT family transporter [Metabacillus dongyingensis]|uniref:DMT family transporter n=1 Tax=Metabacillus dongyingensis TaxID=2874282 RepID=UPI0023DF982F|nr:DMT family transporter [Metabacillus dongyingensis]UAL51437.1 DMT family transporter [Metabacillus dongyingensis]
MKNGVILAILSSFVFSIMNALVKTVSLNIPAAEVMFFRSIIGTAIIFVMMRQSKVAFSKKGVRMLFVRGLLGALYLYAYFYAISKIPLADASIIAHLSTIFAIILSAAFLKEKVSKSTFYILPLVFVGAILLVKPFHYSSYSVYALAGVLSALFAAGAAASIRYLSKLHHSYEIVFYFLATGTILSIPLMWNSFVIPTPLEFFYLACIGVVSLLGQIFLTRAFTHENIVVVEVTRYIGIVFNALWGFLFWTEVPDAYTIIGGTLIIAVCIMLSIKKRKLDTGNSGLAKGYIKKIN